MKKLILLVALTCGFMFASAQKNDVVYDRSAIPFKDGKITYTLIDTVKGLDKAQIFSKMNEWIALNFKSAQNVVQLNDKEAGKIVVKGILKNDFTFRTLGTDLYYPYILSYTIDITIKDDRYRVIFDDLMVEQTGTHSIFNHLGDFYTELEAPKLNKYKASRNKQILVTSNAELLLLQMSIKAHIKKATMAKDDF